MKKLSLILCIVIAIVFTGCGGSAPADLKTDIVGTWTLTSIIDAEGNEQTLEEYCAANGVDSAGVEATYTFADDGSVVAAIGGIGTEGTYEVSSDTTANVTFTSGSAEFTYNAESGALEVSDANSGFTSVFTK